MSTTSVRAEVPVFLFNRKYLGSKRLLREWLAGSMCARAGTPATFLDGFFGTGSVSLAMARRGVGRIVAVDSLRSNCVILRGFTTSSVRTAELLEHANASIPFEGYIWENYSGTYFTDDNCRKMDGVREELERLHLAGEISNGEHDILLASFLLAADRVANTLGQYDAFLKHIGSSNQAGGRHILDDRVGTPFVMRPLDVIAGTVFDVREGDMVALAAEIDADVAYFDPPYNHRQYCDNYHVLENFARWEKPPLFGKTRKFDRTAMKSPFSQKQNAAEALRGLVRGVRARDVFLSYSSEGLLAPDEIQAILSTRGTTSLLEIPYPVFGNGAGVSVRRSVTEYLFHCSTDA